MNIEKLLPNAEKAETFLKALANKHRLMVLCELPLVVSSGAMLKMPVLTCGTLMS